MSNRKKILRAGASAALLALLLPFQAWAQVVLLHTNDIHCGVDRNLTLARVAAYKKQQQALEPQTLLLDAGDAIQGEPLGKLTDGRAMVRILNGAGYDFAIPGNHEFDYGMDNFLSLAKKLKCGYTSCNFVRLDTGKPVLTPYRIFPFKERKVALIGVTTPGTLVSSTPRFFQDGKGHFIYGFCEDKAGVKLYRQVQDTVEEAREQGADTVILVTHLGSDGSIPVWSSRALLAHVTGVDGLIDGHSHEQYEVFYPDRKGKMIPVAQTGTKLQSLGRMVIEDDGTIRGELIRDLPAPDPQVEKLVRKEMAKVDKALAQKVGESPVELVDSLAGQRAVRQKETNLGDFAADAFRTCFKADVALINGGSFRSGLPRGAWTRKTLLTLFPFGNQAVLRSISGQQLLDALELSVSHAPEENGGFLQVSGLTFVYDPAIPSPVKLDDQGNFERVEGKRRVSQVMIGGKPLDTAEDYLVAGTSYILSDGGNGYSMFRDTTLVAEPGLSDVDILADYVQKQGVSEAYRKPEGQGRIRIDRK